MKNKQDIYVNYLKQYGFVFANSEIYGGLANTWDYGPLGVLLKQNIKSLWWKEFVTKDKHVVGFDSAILTNNQVLKASGHLANFSDPLVDCKECKNRFRADKLIEQADLGISINENTNQDTLYQILVDNRIKCPNCQKSNWTKIRKFNLMFETKQGVVEDDKNTIYLRPETAQGIFINFLNVQRTLRLKLPFGIGQIGKAFRNEITPGNFIFRTREFEQMELEYFVEPKDSDKIFDSLLKKLKTFFMSTIGLDEKNLQFYEHKKEELSHYSKRTIDVLFNYPHGFSELCGIANRTDFDLSQHSQFSNTELAILNQETKQKTIPYVIEPSMGVDRLFYAIIVNNYKVEKLDNGESREVLGLPYSLCPYKVAVFALTKELEPQAQKILTQILDANISATSDSSGSIGKRYRRQDAIGTYYCVTIDYDTQKDQKVTIRFRDSMKQERVLISELIPLLSK
ncbi:MAG: glycine--tRNA ligase [Mycoplasmataceae bacterium]|nr:glycine--tRNA ligase [Mycoplasmataceae bacterium]